jgi:hypothetical protein
MELIPDAIDEKTLTVTIPGTLAPGNYDARAIKDVAESNPIVISVKPAVTITDVSCNKKNGRITITGSGFGDKVEGTDGYLNVEVDGVQVETVSWADTQIKTSVSDCSNKASVTVKALFGSATSDGDNGGGGTGPEICNDGIDNDGDGKTDCTDRECKKDPACGGGNPPGNPEVCDDGIDNDGDGKVDCTDRECKKDPAC